MPLLPIVEKLGQQAAYQRIECLVAYMKYITGIRLFCGYGANPGTLLASPRPNSSEQ